MAKTDRIWELDALRGICILGMVVVHLLYDLCYMYGLIRLQSSELFYFITQWGGVLFLLISGICVTLGSHPIRRGLVVLAAGLVVTLVTWGLYKLEFFDKSIIIYFGVLHCLGICMLLWPLLKHVPVWLLPVLGLLIAAVGLHLYENVLVQTESLVWLGLMYPGFQSSDYFPLLPNLGFFILGIFLGRTLYKNKKTLLPKVNPRWFGFFCRCGRLSLFIYLAHQPLIAGAIELYLMLR